MTSKIIFRVDGHQHIGLGHLTRCLALSDMLREDFESVFACQNHSDKVLNLIRNEGIELIELPPEEDYETDAHRLITYLGKSTILVLDGYHFRETYQQIVKPHCFKLVCIDDIHSYHFYADVIINHSEHAKYVKYSCEPETRLYLGGQYALLRRPFWEHAKFTRHFEKSIDHILVCMGGSDPGNQTLRILQTLNLTRWSLTVTAIIGIANSNYDKILQWMGENTDSKLKINLLSNLSAPEMCEQFMQNDFLFAPGSTTALEACCIGIPMIVGIIADNQKGVAQILGEKQAALNIGWYEATPIEDLKNSFIQSVGDPERLRKGVYRQKEIVDGQADLRFKEMFYNFGKFK